MTAYLITWKPATENKEKGWPIEELAALSHALKSTGEAVEPWRFSRRHGVAIGERVFLLRQVSMSALIDVPLIVLGDGRPA